MARRRAQPSTRRPFDDGLVQADHAHEHEDVEGAHGGPGRACWCQLATPMSTGTWRVRREAHEGRTTAWCKLAMPMSTGARRVHMEAHEWACASRPQAGWTRAGELGPAL